MGSFRQGQRLAIRLEGANGDPGLPYASFGSLLINANMSSDKELNFIAPYTGVYSFNLGGGVICGVKMCDLRFVLIDYFSGAFI